MEKSVKAVSIVHIKVVTCIMSLLHWYLVDVVSGYVESSGSNLNLREDV